MNKERLSQLLELDPTTGVLRWKVSVSKKVKVGQVAGSKNCGGYIRIGIDGRRLLAHRIIFLLTHGFEPPEVDHINGHRADNRPSNLRAATSSENNRNACIRSDNNSGIKGVSWGAQWGKWRARVRANGKQHHLGLFADLNAAAAAVHAFRAEHHGQFARH